ncbi:MAG: pantoate--beta-alanine ligase [Verrucomicrobia bacterium]|nr:pantoate--beta-alanine ligase [Verrucomicrobiota bacterium]NBU09942.1 pantoate--beta-alanine ligase [Pseudomonadota bacterium]NDA66553.1 pantoate--beta-alanine ligase [Verrucomicrobiota bacterium]NDB75356.1 pantoate--beta-alanine ligase [Verrucomicrobiota bacterium]NDD37750.1 pantoate--beta-alanine ligase [Verrucomicrobiota bacterium]
MRIVTSAAAMQRLALRWRRAGIRVGIVPTMGYLHDGHLSLVSRARRLVGKRGIVVASIYVNPTQFAPTEDLSAYPRDLERDTQLCRKAGVEVLFLPSDAEMYPGRDSGGYSTYVVEERLSQGMEGGSRPTHFPGVTTVVAKLFNLVLPEVAVFGAKDWQQAAILRRMTRDLNFPLKFVVAPTRREKDGLAMSSRNKYLSAEERPQATILFRALKLAKEIVLSSRAPNYADVLKREIAALITTQPAARLDYVEFFDGETLQPATAVTRGTHMALAVFIGKTRLIDNAELR